MGCCQTTEDQGLIEFLNKKN